MHPILFQWGSMTIYSYGFFVAVAMITALLIAERRAGRYGFESSQIADLVFATFIFGILGARILYVCQHTEEYQSDWMRVFWIREGGLVWYGGFFGSVMMGIIYARWRGWRVIPLFDFFAPIIPLAHGIGRLGCFLNGCCYGHDGIPSQLIEAVCLFFLSAVLFKISYRKKRDGDVFLFYLVGYSLVRFFVEFTRGDNLLYFYFSLPQWMSLALFLAATGIFLIENRKR